jgi:hypothetical protein
MHQTAVDDVVYALYNEIMSGCAPVVPVKLQYALPLFLSSLGIAPVIRPAYGESS